MVLHTCICVLSYFLSTNTSTHKNAFETNRLTTSMYIQYNAYVCAIQNIRVVSNRLKNTIGNDRYLQLSL